MIGQPHLVDPLDQTGCWAKRFLAGSHFFLRTVMIYPASRYIIVYAGLLWCWDPQYSVVLPSGTAPSSVLGTVLVLLVEFGGMVSYPFLATGRLCDPESSVSSIFQDLRLLKRV